MQKFGKYTISGEIGKGGMGIVYRGSDPCIGRTVAIKTVRLDVLRQESGRDDRRLNVPGFRVAMDSR